MSKSTLKNLEALRDEMRRVKVSAVIIPGTDYHQSEYISDHWKFRDWVTGFTGSNGTAVVTLDNAGLWTDSRYFIAAEQQLVGTEFMLMKERMPGTPTISKWLGVKLSYDNDPNVGIDGNVCSAAMVKALTSELRAEGGITLRTNFDPLSKIWKDRPALPESKVVVHPMKYCGESCASKLARIRAELKERHVCGMIVGSLDDIAPSTQHSILL